MFKSVQGLLASAGGVGEGVWKSFANVQCVQSCRTRALSLISNSISQSDAVPLSGSVCQKFIKKLRALQIAKWNYMK